MAIRFQCQSCSEPIEVDDEWALRMVACPYCHETVTAPSESTLPESAPIPVASPLAEMVPGSMPEPPPPTMVLSPQRPNWIARVAMGSAVGSLVLMGMANMVMAPHSLEMKALQDRAEELRKEGQEGVVAMQQALTENYGGLPPRWMMLGGLLLIGAAVAWLAAIVCGLIGARRPQGRRLAITSLVMAAVVPLIFCGGTILR